MRIQDVVFPILTSFILSAVLGRLLIPLLRKVKAGQTVREDGPATHLKKSGTPTMGGIIILLSILIASIPYLRTEPEIFPVLMMTFGFGLIGFLDDFIKVVLHRSMGLSSFQKFFLQFLMTAVFWCYLQQTENVDLMMKIPFCTNRYLSFGILTVPVFFFIVIGTVNGVNLTDGLDGLAGSVTLLIAVLLMMVSIFEHSGLYPVTGAAAGALLGFLLFNVYPASVFMGDTGSLALGGFVVSSAYLMKLPLFLPMIGAIYVLEVLSVILQVAFYKLTGGRRLFHMAPLHHHLELSGWEETRIVAVFTIVTTVMCLLALLGI